MTKITEFQKAAQKLKEFYDREAARANLARLEAERKALETTVETMTAKVASLSGQIDEALVSGQDHGGLVREAEDAKAKISQAGIVLDRLNSAVLPAAQATAKEAQAAFCRALTALAREFQEKQAERLEPQLLSLLNEAWGILCGVHDVFKGLDATRTGDLVPLLPIPFNCLNGLRAKYQS